MKIKIENFITFVLAAFFLITLGMSIVSAQSSPACVPLKFINGNASPNTVDTGDNYTVTCNYGNINNDTRPVPSSGSCAYTSYTGLAAQFSCIAPPTPGTVTLYCSTNTGTSNNNCAQQNPINSVSVSAIPITITQTYTGPGFTCVTGCKGNVNCLNMCENVAHGYQLTISK